MVGLRQRRWWVFGLAAGLAACSSPLPSNVCATSVTYTTTYTTKVNNDLDLVFVIDDGPAMAGWQAKLATQLPLLMKTVQSVSSPSGLHVGVVSSDLGVGAATNVGIPGCTASGDGGNLRSQPEGMCSATTLDPSAGFISEIGSNRNFTAPDDATESGAAQVFACIAQLGAGGCGFGQPLAALARALGPDGQPPPPENAGFLRPHAYLGIVFISNQDDCSASAGSSLFSLADPSANDLDDPQGPLTPYRCNHAGHLCADSHGNQVSPPIQPTADATSVDGVPTLALTNCQSNEGDGVLTPVSTFVSEIRSLKPDPDNQILVSGIVGPPSPYAVEWLPQIGGTTPGELWPRVAPSCGAEAADGSGAFGEPAVRLAQFINGFRNSVLGSVCDDNYTEALRGLTSAPEEGQPPCLPSDIRSKTDPAGNSYPDCVVTEHLTTADGNTQEFVLPPCSSVAAGAACWSIGGTAVSAGCPAGSPLFTVSNEPLGPDPSNITASQEISCQLTLPADAGSCPD
ncbi:MAG TPA: hypothetical protein VLC06_04535 [Polyangia bacterium]|nr:hypothetical protein [Polyangia bacterium]